VGGGEKKERKLKDTDMISENTFAHAFTSFWRSATPTSERFVRRLNVEFHERIYPPLPEKVAPARRGLINEIAFGLFRAGASELPRRTRLDRALFANAVGNARARMALMEPRSVVDGPTRAEVQDILAQVDRMNSYFGGMAAIKVDPEFPGCGFLDACVGDVLVAGTLYEVKAGERTFRSVDIRQLLIYAALNRSAGKYTIDSVGVFNPRVGIAFETPLDDLCVEISGTNSIELLSEIIFAVSRGDMSR
jgi:hypothetical protein